MKRTMKILITIFGTFTVYLVANIIAGLLLGVYYGALYGEEGSPGGFDAFFTRNTNVLLIVASLIALAIFWLVYKLRGERLFQALNVREMKFKAILGSVFIGGFFSLFLFSVISITNIYRLFPSHGEVMESIIPAEGNFLLIFLSIAIVVPIFEEVMHRGIIYQQLKKGLPLPLAILAQALIFGIFHLNWLQGMYAFLGGIVLALLYEYTRSLWAPILMHMGWNATSLFIPPIYSNGVLGAIMIISLGMLIMLLKKFKEKRTAENEYIESYDLGSAEK